MTTADTEQSKPPVSQALTTQGIPHRVYRHTQPVSSLEEAAAERGQTPDQIVRSLLFRVDVDTYVMVLIAGPSQVSWRALRRHLGQSRLTMAQRDEVLAVTGYPIGGVAPFGLPQPLRVLVDSSVFVPAEVSLGSGVRGTAVILQREELRKALEGAEIGDFQDDPTE